MINNVSSVRKSTQVVQIRSRTCFLTKNENFQSVLRGKIAKTSNFWKTIKSPPSIGETFKNRPKYVFALKNDGYLLDLVNTHFSLVNSENSRELFTFSVWALGFQNVYDVFSILQVLHILFKISKTIESVSAFVRAVSHTESTGINIFGQTIGFRDLKARTDFQFPPMVRFVSTKIYV